MKPGDVFLELDGIQHRADVLEVNCGVYRSASGKPCCTVSLEVQDPKVDPQEGAFGMIYFEISLFGKFLQNGALKEAHLTVPDTDLTEPPDCSDIDIIFYRMGTHGEIKSFQLDIVPLSNGLTRFGFSGKGIDLDQEIPLSLLFDFKPTTLAEFDSINPESQVPRGE